MYVHVVVMRLLCQPALCDSIDIYLQGELNNSLSSLLPLRCITPNLYSDIMDSQNQTFNNNVHSIFHLCTGEYITLYQTQRKALKVKFQEKEEFIRQLLVDKETIQVM